MGLFNVCWGAFGRILEIPSRFSRMLSCLSYCFKITAYRAGHLTTPYGAVQEKLLLHYVSLAIIQLILLLGSKEAHWKLPVPITV